ncbi:phosphopantetheine-binding protein [Streptomyces sp. NPDC088251]|uniref:phosphopantetheine-binding protein n=1 Tax=unclassified Streptomyces TaxID=2593676 RepID=UPI00382586F6
MNSDTTPEEECLRRLYAEVLKVDSVGPDDSFFALSGDSLAVMRLVGRARAAGLHIGVRDVFESKTVRELALAARVAAAPTAGEPERPGAAGAAPPTSLSQEELDDIASDLRN